LTDIAWNTTSLGVWTVSGNTVAKVEPYGWTNSYNSGQSGTTASKAYNIYNEDANHATQPSWLGYTRAAPGVPSDMNFGIQFPNGTAGYRILVNGENKLTNQTYDSNTKFEINMEKDYDYPTFLEDDSVIYTSLVHADFATAYYISTNAEDAGITLKGDYEAAAAPTATNITFPQIPQSHSIENSVFKS